MRKPVTALLVVLLNLNCLISVFAIELGDKIIKQATIVIKTPDGNYDQPNLDDYKNCMKNYDTCVAACNSAPNCLATCPKCPILVNEDMIIQGINDTDYKSTATKSVNTTNIIRLTNEIHNIIDNNLGNLVANNQNNINVYQESNNATTTHKANKTCNSNKYGMGCNEHGPCCIVISKHQRQKHCGERCQAHVMYASSVVQCTDENDLNTCEHVIEYKPYRARRHLDAQQQQQQQSNRCRYQREWPYVSCKNKRNEIMDDCSPMCLELAYVYILQHGVPLQCINCYKRLNTQPIIAAPVGFAPQALEGDTRDDWVLEAEKWP